VTQVVPSISGETTPESDLVSQSRAHIGSNCIIGACALVTEGMHIPSNSLVLGAPGRVVKTVRPEQAGLLSYMWEEYVELSRAYKHQRHDLERLC
jgi:carbonic anhydrase/acetyltransferase-like protein (isoleucine patch superfamily)